MEPEDKVTTSGTLGEGNSNNNEPIVSDKSLEGPTSEAGLPGEIAENGDTGTTTTITETSVENLSTKHEPETPSANLPNQVIIHEDIKVKNVSAVQVNITSSLQTASMDGSQDSAALGATASLPQSPNPPSPGKVLVYRNVNLHVENCKFVQVGDNNSMVIQKVTPQQDAFVKACCELDIDPKTADDIREKLSRADLLQQFAKKMAETYSVTCKIRRATKGCILLELEVPTEADRLQLLRMARDGTFQQVLLETFLPELAAKGRAVNMNLAIGVRNPSQDMVDELQGAVASSDQEDVVVVEIPAAANNDPSASKQENPESTEGLAEAMPQGAAAASISEEFDEKTPTCPVCKSVYDDPRVLPCLHTFCARCLEQWRQGQSQFTCPTCRHQVRLQGTSVSSHNLLGVSTAQPSKEAHAQCQMCDSGARVEGSCSDCAFFVCKTCIGIHEKTPALQDHHITAIDTTIEYCPKHVDQPLIFYCQPCTKLVCQKCTVTGHQPGPNHGPQEISKVSQKYKDELQVLMRKTQEAVDELKKTDITVGKEITSIATNYDVQKKRIKEHFAQLRTELDKAEQEIVVKLDTMKTTLREPLLKEKKNLMGNLKSIEDRLKFCRDIIARDNDVEHVMLGSHLQDNLNHILRTNKVSHEGLKGLIVFQADTKTVAPTTGSLSLHNTSIIVPGIPVESLPNTIIFRPTSKELLDVDRVQVTVTPSGGKRAIYTCTSTETSEGLFETIWRPQILGRHEVGAILKRRVQKERGLGVYSYTYTEMYQPNTCTVYVGSNNPVLRFGGEGSQQGQFNTPLDVAVKGDRLYVAEKNRIQVFDLNGHFCFLFSSTAKFNLGSVAVQTDGTIVVSSGNKVLKFSPSGKLKNKFSLGKYCTDLYGLAVQRSGRVVVTDEAKQSIFLFEADGTLVKQVGGQGKGKFDDPGFVCVDEGDNIIVADTGNDCIQVFDRNLNFKHKFGQFGRQPQDMWGPLGVSSDSRGNIVLSNVGEESDIGGVEHGKKLQVFRPNGTWVSTISSDWDKLKSPRGVAVTEDGHVFVADTDDHCIRKYRYM